MFYRCRCLLIVSVLFFMIAGGGVSFAQDDDTFMLEEITVTAEKRTVNVQDTAMSVTAVSGSDIRDSAVTDLKGVLEGLAGVNVMGGPGGGNVFIRGIGSAIDGNIADPSVSVQLDGIYVGNSEVAFASMYDVERVEVLRGPQGTMYGKNAAGGQVNVVSKKPTDEYGGYATVSIGNYDMKKIETAVNFPMTEKWYSRVAMTYNEREGYVSDGSDNADKFASRAKVLYEANEKLSILFSAEYSHDQSRPANTVPTPGSAGNLMDMGFVVPDANADGKADDFLDADLEETDDADDDGWPDGDGIADIVQTGWVGEDGNDPWSNDAYHPAPYSDNEYQFYEMEVNYSFDWSELTLTPTLTESSRNLYSELIWGTSQGGELSVQPYEQTQLTAEARLQNPEGSSVQWLVGAYWIDSDNRDAGDAETVDPLQSSEEAGGGWASLTERRPSDSISYFAQATVPVGMERFRITGGIRFNSDNTHMAYRFANYDIAEGEAYYDEAQVAADGRHYYDSGALEWENNQEDITYRAGMEFDFSEDNMLYAYVSTGYKSGGINLRIVPVQEYDPEELMAYTIGTKNRFLDNRLQINTEAYYYDYDGYQMQCYTSFIDTLTGEETTDMLIVNAESGTNIGFEIEADLLLTVRDKLDITFAYMDTEYGEATLPGGPFGGPMEMTGKEMANAPTGSGTLAYSHTWIMDNGGDMTAKFQTKITDGYYTTHEQYLAGAWQDGYMMSDVYLTYYAPSGDYSAGLWVKNLENEDVTTRCMPSYRRAISAPRTVGLTFTVQF